MGAVGCDSPTHQWHICLLQDEKLLRTFHGETTPWIECLSRAVIYGCIGRVRKVGFRTFCD
ncbi:MAG: hypothetical protein KatS3mg056_1050 [Chloroflexus sp.]|nr:MAG: hypothetical protein KatS3mg056_1050 [Chloroflexus sp.]